MLEINKIYNEDCIGNKGMSLIADKSVDMILCDLPYGTTACKWDVIIPFKFLWEHYKRMIKDNGAIVLFGREPFTSQLINSNLKGYKHKWVWNKKQSGSFHLAKYQPLQIEEDIIIFTSNGEKVNYYPIMRKGKLRVKGGATTKHSTMYGMETTPKKESDLYYPTNIIEIPQSRLNRVHPTQKPVELLEYLIKTYSKENELILDNCIGSGSTCVAAINTNRNYIGFEFDKNYYDIANKRIESLK